MRPRFSDRVQERLGSHLQGVLMAKRIVVIRDGEASLLHEVEVGREVELQDRLRSDPDLLPIDDLELPGPLMVVGRETSLQSGSADLVAVARDGNLLVIELKTGPQNPDFRHALAQVLDYGAGLWGMSIDEFESGVAARYFRSPHCPTDSPTRGMTDLSAAARATWPDITASELEQFRDRLGRVLIRGEIHYLVVAQRLRDSMKRTAEYLNTIAAPARFVLVEMIRFEGAGMAAFEARTVFASAARRSDRQLLDEATFLERIADERYRTSVQRLVETCRSLDLRFEWGTSGASIRIGTPDKPEPVSVAWVFPPGAIGWMGLTDLTFGYDPEQAESAPSAHAALESYVEQIGQLEGAEPVSKAGIRAHSFTPEHFMQRESSITELIAKLVAET